MTVSPMANAAGLKIAGDDPVGLSGRQLLNLPSGARQERQRLSPAAAPQAKASVFWQTGSGSARKCSVFLPLQNRSDETITLSASGGAVGH